MADAKVVPILPTQDATADVARRRPGRPRSVEKKPTLDDLEYHARVAEHRLRFLEEDSVVRSVEDKAAAPKTIHEIRINLAREAADLEFLKQELGKRGRDTAQVISRRVDVLMRLANLELDAMRTDASTLDPRSEPMQRIFRMWIEELKNVVVQILDQPQADAFFNTLASRMEGWEDEVAKVLR